MRVILAGQKSFGLAAYEMLLDAGHDVVGVWSPQRSDKLSDRATEDRLWVSTFQRTPKAVQMLEADLFVAAHSHDFISKQACAATGFGGMAYHPSLLPRHRGRDAVRWTIHMGDAVTGGSVYWLTDNVDGGPIAAQEHVLVRPGVDASTLWRTKLFPLGIQLLLDALDDIDRGVIIEVPQDEACATWEPSWERPPLHRPDLPQIGSGVPGMTHITSRTNGATWRSLREMKGAV
jgi:methionyl-tRNA formyltransferase